MTSYTREEWGSAYPRGGYEIPGPVSEVYVHHFNSGIQPARSVTDAMARMRGAQAYHASANGWGDIGYSWCVDDIGNDYEGRGWWRTGAHTYGFNSKGYGICWLGDSNVSVPTDAALAAIATVINRGIGEGAIVETPTVVAHRDRVPETSCCGDPMYALLDRVRLQVGHQPTSGDDDVKLVRTPDGTVWASDGVTITQLAVSYPMVKRVFAGDQPDYGIPVSWGDVGDLLASDGRGGLLPLRTVLAMLAAAKKG